MVLEICILFFLHKITYIFWNKPLPWMCVILMNWITSVIINSRYFYIIRWIQYGECRHRTATHGVLPRLEQRTWTVSTVCSVTALPLSLRPSTDLVDSLHGPISQCIVGPSVTSAPWRGSKVEFSSTSRAATANQIAVMQIHVTYNYNYNCLHSCVSAQSNDS